MGTLNDYKILEILKEQFERYKPEWKLSICNHSIIVRDLALFLAEQIMINNKNQNIYLKLLSSSCLLHDIGYARAKKSIDHGVYGGKILREMGFDKEARASERHIGVGIEKKDSIKLGVGDCDFIPETIEEQILCYADNLCFFDKKTKKHTIKSSKEVSERFGLELGEKYRIRTIEFNKKIEDMVGTKGMSEFKDYIDKYNQKLNLGSELKL